MKVFGNTVDVYLLVPGSVVVGEGRSERGKGPGPGTEREKEILIQQYSSKAIQCQIIMISENNY